MMSPGIGNVSLATESWSVGVGVGVGSVGGVKLGSRLDSDDLVSPVTLAADWSRVARILLLSSLSVIGSVGNVFMISAIMIEDHLKKRGNAFIVNVALADLLITGLVFPASTIVILAGQHDTATVCTVQWLLAVLCCLVTIMTQAAMAVENLARLCMSPDCYEFLTPARITAFIVLIWILGAGAVAIQTAFQLGPDYCNRRFPGVLPHLAVLASVFVFVPVIVTFACYVRILTQVHWAKAQPAFKPPVAFSWDYSLMKTNMYSFFMFVVFWLPFGVILGIGSIPTISARMFYNLAWIALSKSCFNNVLYCVANRHFRNAYVNLFHYCCFKTTVSFSRRPRGEVTRPTGDVRVHIIPGYNMYSYTSPQRAREATAATAKRSAPRPANTRPSSRPNGGRDVYEL